MNIEIAKVRMNDVFMDDATDISDNSFLLTHVPLRKIVPLNRFEMQPNYSKKIDEETILRDYVCNPDNLHQMVTIYGESGTGKSHFIRWLKTRFEQIKPESEVVLFVRRENNTLSSTIRQLLEIPEVKALPDSDRYRRLTEASQIKDRDKLRTKLLNELSTEVQYYRNEDTEGPVMPQKDLKRITSFLKSEYTAPGLEAPIDRIISKILPSEQIVERDVVAAFTAEDFEFVQEADFIEQIHESADSRTKKLVDSLNADEANSKKEELAAFLNLFIEKVIQDSTGIFPEDLKQIFLEIRRELKKAGKNLTIFIEDVTAFAGVDQVLLDALMVRHTGRDDKTCRLSSFVGVTSHYLNTNFKSNHKDRVTKYLYLPKDIFDQSQQELFFAKYLNAVSLSRDDIGEWLTKNQIQNTVFPVAKDEGPENWDHVSVGEEISLSLYPFTRNAVKNLYSTLPDKTPRYVLKDILKPNLTDFLSDKDSFPRHRQFLKHDDIKLIESVDRQVSDSEEAMRLKRFLTNWGTGIPYSETTPQGITLQAGVTDEMLKCFSLPLIRFPENRRRTQQVQSNIENRNIQGNSIREKQKSQTTNNSQSETVESDNQSFESLLNSKQRSGYLDQRNELVEWVNGKVISLTTRVGIDAVLKSALSQLSKKYVIPAINWRLYGITQGTINRIADTDLLSMEGAKNIKDSAYVLKRGSESYGILMAMIRLNTYRSDKELDKKFDYPEALSDTMLISEWIRKHQKFIIEKVRTTVDQKTVEVQKEEIKRILASKVLNGEIRDEKQLKGLKAKELFSVSGKEVQSDSRSGDWTKAGRVIEDSEENGQLKYMFNLPLESGKKESGVVILDSLPLATRLDQAKSEFITELHQKDTDFDRESKKDRSSIIQKIQRAVDSETEFEKKQINNFSDILSLGNAGLNRKIVPDYRKLEVELDKNDELRLRLKQTKKLLNGDEQQKLKDYLQSFNSLVKELRNSEAKKDYIARAAILSKNDLTYLEELRRILLKVENISKEINSVYDRTVRQVDASGVSLEQMQAYEINKSALVDIIQQTGSYLENVPSGEER